MTSTATSGPATPQHQGRPGRRPPAWRIALLLPAGLALVAGLDAALLLLGVPAPVRTDRLPEVHGMLLVLGFVGTLVSAERAVALGHRAGFLAPALLGSGGLLLVSPAPLIAGRLLLLAGAAALTAVYLPLWRRQRDDAVLVQAFGAVLALGALLLWLGGVPVPHLVPWLAGFLVLTIGGERLELARLAMGAGAGTTLLLLATALVVGTVATLLWPDVGHPLLGLALLALTGWLARHDVARVTARSAGLPRFMAANMLTGYVWLAVAGGIWALTGTAYDGPAYDAVVHAVFLGFTVAMIMAHAPVILPAVLGRPLPYHPVLIVPAALLHASLVLRLWAGDALGVAAARQVGGVLNILAVMAFVVLAAWSAARPAGARP